MRILVANIPTSFVKNEFLWSPTGKAVVPKRRTTRGEHPVPKDQFTLGRTRGPLVRDRLNSNE